MLKKSQVWIETVIYTLIGLTVIGLILSFATPKIAAIRDKAIIEQTITALSDIDKVLSDISLAPGNIRYVVFTLQKGNLIFNAPENKIEFILEDSAYTYSEANKEIPATQLNLGTLNVFTEVNKTTNVKIWIDYSGNLELTYNNLEQGKKLSSASVAYRIRFENEKIDGGVALIDIESS